MEPTQNELSTFVNNNVMTYQSMLVDHLLEKEIFSYDEITNLYEYKCPQCGHGDIDEQSFAADEGYKCPSCEECFDTEPESESQEIYEWWIVNEWLLDKLEEKGEPVLRTDYGNWWGRTTTGQAIMLDWVIAVIYKTL